MRLFWYVSRTKLRSLVDRSEANELLTIDRSPRAAAVTSDHDRCSELPALEQRLASDTTIPEVDELDVTSPPLFFRFEGPSGRLIQDGHFWLATVCGDTAVLLVGSAANCFGGQPVELCAISPSADPIGAVNAVFSDSKAAREPSAFSGSISYAWGAILRRSLAEAASLDSLPRTRGAAVYAGSLDAVTSGIQRGYGGIIRRVVIGSPLFVEQIAASRGAAPRHQPASPSTRIRVFVSYSHDSKAHDARVLALADELRGDGIDVSLDRYILHASEGWPQWTQKQLVEADFVLLICTPNYRRRFEGEEASGEDLDASWTATIALRLLYDAGGRNDKLLPVLFEEGTEQDIPLVLRSSTWYRVPGGYEELYRRLTGQPMTPPSPLGEVQPMPPPTRPGLLVHERIDDHDAARFPATTDPDIDVLRDALAKGAVVAFVGPGASVAGGLLSWSKLACMARTQAARIGVAGRDLRDIDEAIVRGDLADAFTELAMRLGSAALTRLISTWLDDRHGPGGQPIAVPAVAAALAGLAPRLRAVITTNLDSFLDRAFPRDWEVFERPVGDLAHRQRYIIHLHGVVRDCETWVLTRSDYDRLTVAGTRYAAYFSAMARTHQFVFVGFELGDRDFERIVERIRTLADAQPVQHFAFVRSVDISGAQRRKVGEAGITLLEYGDHPDLPGLLRRLT